MSSRVVTPPASSPYVYLAGAREYLLERYGTAPSIKTLWLWCHDGRKIPGTSAIVRLVHRRDETGRLEVSIHALEDFLAIVDPTLLEESANPGALRRRGRSWGQELAN